VLLLVLVRVLNRWRSPCPHADGSRSKERCSPVKFLAQGSRKRPSHDRIFIKQTDIIGAACSRYRQIGAHSSELCVHSVSSWYA